MPQQINLSTPVLLAQKRYFSAQTMLLALAVFLVCGGAMMVWSLWELRGATATLQATRATQEPELSRLRVAVAESKAAAGAGDQVVLQQVQAARAQLLERERTLVELQFGQLPPGRSHSARLLMVAQSVPPQAWVTGIRADATQMEVSGFTQEPAALNDWVAAMARSPVLAGQQLLRVRVEQAPPSNGGRALWSFTLGSAAPAGAGSAP